MSNTPAPPPPPEAPTTDQVLDQHRDALKQRFPLPGPETLRRRGGGAKRVLPVLLVLAGAVLVADPAWQVRDYQTGVGGTP